MSSVSIYEIKLCKYDDIDDVRTFIDLHWKANHSLVASQDLLHFQHFNKDIQGYNFVIARNTSSGEIDGLIGFIPTFQYDNSLKEELDYWGAIWKVRTDITNAEIKTLGLEIFEKFLTITSCKTFGAIGISPIAKKIYKALRYNLGVLHHYYIYNQTLEAFTIADIKRTIISKDSNRNKIFSLKKLDTLDGVNKIICKSRPLKTIQYFVNRYQFHPIYSYSFLGIYSNAQLNTLLAIRTVEIGASKAIRIVDMLGDFENLPNLSAEIQNFLAQEKAEYIDCLNFGIKEQIFERIGFLQVMDDDENIIPNHFEPFEKKNIKVEFTKQVVF